MSFLKFLKREKKESFDELDLPPAPPPLEGFEDTELPEFPELPEEKISAPEMQEMPKFGFPEKEGEMPGFPDFPEMEEEPSAPAPSSATMQPVAAPLAPEPVEEESPVYDARDAYPKITGRLFSHADENQGFSGHRKFEEFSREKMTLRERPTAKTIYVRVDNFKATLGSINMVRSDLRKSDEALMKLESIKHAKDRSFDKVKASLDDLQKKLIFVDKTLFKGD